MLLLAMHLRATTLIILIVLMRSLWLFKIPKKIFMGLWGLVIARLCIPYTLHLVMGFTFLNFDHLALRLMDALHLGSSMSQSTNTDFTLTVYVIPWYVWCVLILGTFLLTLYIIIGHLRCKRYYSNAQNVHTPYINTWQQTYNIKRDIQIKQTSDITSALTYGIWHPVILLPATMDIHDEKTLRFVLAHELGHIRHYDMIWKWLSVIILCFNWFNPLVWVMYVLLNRDIELHCDEFVMKDFGITKHMKKDYANTLLLLAEEKRKAFSLASYFSKNATEERVLSIMHSRYASILWNVIAILCFIGLAFLMFSTFFTGDAEIGMQIPLTK